MSEFNYFGLTTNDIVESFNGALVTDFASNSKTGAEIIENELQLAEGELIGLLTPKVIRKFYNTEVLDFAEYTLYMDGGFLTKWVKK